VADRRVVIAGGDGAGMSAAFKIKRIAPSIEVVVYEAGLIPSYGACGLPYFISGVIADWQSLIARTPEEIRSQGIDLRLGHRVVKIYPKERRILVRREATGECFLDSYDEFLAATGARAARPKVEGLDSRGIYTLGTIPDAIAIREAALDPAKRNVVIVGGGFIGAELVESFSTLGKNVVLIEKAARFLPQFEGEISAILAEEAAAAGVVIKPGESLAHLVAADGTLVGVSTDRAEYPADIAVLCLGVKPQTAYFEASGIDTLANGALRVDARMHSSLPHIWAAGDCASVRHFQLDSDAYLPLGTNANKQGRLAGEHIAREALGTEGPREGGKRFAGVLGSAVIKLLGLEAARTGLGLEEAKAAGLGAASVLISAPDHAVYYPDSSPVTFLLIYSPTDHRILGAQAVGRRGAALRIDVIAAAIQGGLCTEEFGLLDLCYAPPFASVWDVLHVAANAVK